ncbi:MAG: hypothetical protein ACE5DK_06665 [Paracoccaceae bacterium]
MLRLLLTSLILVAGLSVAAVARTMVDLPVNTRTLAATYVYCLTGDSAAAADMLAQRIRFAAKGDPNDGQGWVSKGYCRAFVQAADKAVPELRNEVVSGLAAQGFTTDEPVTSQAKKGGKKGKGKLGKLIRGIGKFLGGLFGGASVGGHGTYFEYSNEQTGESMSYCDKSWHAGAGNSAFDPTPFVPNR